MYEKLLRECGLTQNETAVYVALLKIGKATSSKIIQEAKISGGKIYETLRRLIEKGLVKTFSENGIKQFIANDPSMLLVYLKEKEKALLEQEKELEKAIPFLTNIKGKYIPHEAVELMKGTRATRELIFRLLENSSEIKIMGVRSNKEMKYNNLWKEWHKKRVSSKKKARVLFSDIGTAYWDFFKKLPRTEVRAIPHFSPAAIMILDDSVLIFSYEEDLTCIHIRAKAITQSFDLFFNELWNISIK